MNTQAESQKGFNIIELMIVIAIIATLVVVGIPELRNYLLNNNLTTQTNALVGAMNFARSEAITRNQEINVAKLGDEWGKGWVVWGERHPNCGAAPPVADGKITRLSDGSSCEELRVYDGINKQVEINGPTNLDEISQARTVALNDRANTLTYRGDGTLALTGNAVEFTVCDSRTGEKGRHVRVLRTGRVVLENSEYNCD